MIRRAEGSVGAGVPAGGALVLLRLADGEVRRPLEGLRAAEVIAGVPVRMARSVRGQRHFPGWYWSATTGRHVLYESRLELAWLLCADFDPAVVAIAAQPFALRCQVGDRLRRHVPDFLWLGADGSVGVVNVKPADALADAEVAEALAWPGRLVEAHGWEYAVWSGDDPVFLANLRFLAGYRRPGLVSDALVAQVHAAVRPGDELAAVAGRLAGVVAAPVVRAALLRLLWSRRLSVDLRRPLSSASRVEVVR